MCYLTIEPALIIKAEVMKWVYTAGTEKPKSVMVEQVKPKMGGFFSSIFSGLTGTSTPQRAPTPLPPIIDEKDLLSTNESSVVLSIFTADVDVELTKKMSQELHRSTKKNPPIKLKYELIYVGCVSWFSCIFSDFNRPEKMNTMPARKRMRASRKPQVACSRV
jgi:Protein of unknown function (DUF3684)